jgi:branched-chain amino acid transport system ATP-binding protein
VGPFFLKGGAMGALLETKGLTKSFGALRAVDDVSLTLAAGDSLGIIGPNGAGKSSLFNLIAGVMPADAGQVLWQGRDITTLSAAGRCREGVGRTYQIPKPFDGLTVYENLLVAAEFGGGGGGGGAEAALLCCNILEQMELSHLADAPAGGLRLLERKRLEMARALATRPKVLLLDEIAGGLTDLECGSLIAAIRDIKAQGVAIIWIEHVVHALFAVVDRLAVINFGAKIAEGPPKATFESAEVQSIYLGIEA